MVKETEQEVEEMDKKDVVEVTRREVERGGEERVRGGRKEEGGVEDGGIGGGCERGGKGEGGGTVGGEGPLLVLLDGRQQPWQLTCRERRSARSLSSCVRGDASSLSCASSGTAVGGAMEAITSNQVCPQPSISPLKM